MILEAFPSHTFLLFQFYFFFHVVVGESERAPGVNGSDKEQLCGYTPFASHVCCAQRVAKTPEETISEQPGNQRKSHVCRRLYPSQCTSPSVSLLILLVTEG